MTKCPKARCLIAAVAVFLVLILSENLFHHCPYMHNLYIQTAAVWRPLDEIKTMMPWIFGHYILLAMVIACLYGKFACNAPMPACGTDAPASEKMACCPHMRGVCFGLKIGLLMGLMKTDIYPYLPIPLDLALAWFAGCLFEGVLIGLVLSFIYKKSACDKGTPAA